MGSAVPYHHSCFSPPPAPPSRLKHVWSKTTSKLMTTGNFRFANDAVCPSCSSYLFFNAKNQEKGLELRVIVDHPRYILTGEIHLTQGNCPTPL
ncbi:hypothetical protein V6Z12_D01G210500 [Gossypium hirsutum]